MGTSVASVDRVGGFRVDISRTFERNIVCRNIVDEDFCYFVFNVIS